MFRVCLLLYPGILRHTVTQHVVVCVFCAVPSIKNIVSGRSITCRNTSCFIFQLSAGTRYTVNVIARNIAGNGPTSEGLVFNAQRIMDAKIHTWL